MLAKRGDASTGGKLTNTKVKDQTLTFKEAGFQAHYLAVKLTRVVRIAIGKEQKCSMSRDIPDICSLIYKLVGAVNLVYLHFLK